MRSVRMHTWPEWMKLDHAAASAALSRSAPGRTTNGDLLPSSVTHGISRSPQREAIFRPVATEPVNMTASTRSTSGCGGNPMLARARLRDDPLLAHPPRQQPLAQRVVDLVRAGVQRSEERRVG